MLVLARPLLLHRLLPARPRRLPFAAALSVLLRLRLAARLTYSTFVSSSSLVAPILSASTAAGFMGTGANRLGDILDEIRPVAPGLYIGYAFAKDRRDSRGKNQPHSSFYFALAAVKQQAVAS